MDKNIIKFAIEISNYFIEQQEIIKHNNLLNKKLTIYDYIKSKNYIKDVVKRFFNDHLEWENYFRELYNTTRVEINKQWLMYASLYKGQNRSNQKFI